MSAVDDLRARAEQARQRGFHGVAALIEENAAKGDEHAAQYLDMMKQVGQAARRIREREGW